MQSCFIVQFKENWQVCADRWRPFCNKCIMTIQVEHTLPKEEAKRRIEGLIERYQEEYKDQLQDLSVEWKEEKAHIRVSARGYSSAGDLEITDSAVHLDFYVPFLLQVFGKKIKSTIQHTIEERLA
jgi:hypothetical protein